MSKKIIILVIISLYYMIACDILYAHYDPPFVEYSYITAEDASTPHASISTYNGLSGIYWNPATLYDCKKYLASLSYNIAEKNMYAFLDYSMKDNLINFIGVHLPFNKFSISFGRFIPVYFNETLDNPYSIWFGKFDVYHKVTDKMIYNSIAISGLINKYLNAGISINYINNIHYIKIVDYLANITKEGSSYGSGISITPSVLIKINKGLEIGITYSSSYFIRSYPIENIYGKYNYIYPYRISSGLTYKPIKNIKITFNWIRNDWNLFSYEENNEKYFGNYIIDYYMAGFEINLIKEKLKLMCGGKYYFEPDYFEENERIHLYKSLGLQMNINKIIVNISIGNDNEILANDTTYLGKAGAISINNTLINIEGSVTF